MGDFAYVNGTVMPTGQAMVPIGDAGFLFGDGLFETLRVYDGRPFMLEDPLERLAEGLKALDIRHAPPRDELTLAVAETVKANGRNDCVVRLTVSRGMKKPNVVVTTRPVSYSEAQYKNGVACVTTPETRGSLAAYKTLNYLPNRLAKLAAEKAGAMEAIFINGDGLVTEGSMSNVFTYDGESLTTPALGGCILPGITRRVTLELAKRAGIDVAEAPVTRHDMAFAQEVFITNSALEIMPVVAVDGKLVSNGRPGDMSVLLRARYKDLV